MSLGSLIAASTVTPLAENMIETRTPQKGSRLCSLLSEFGASAGNASEQNIAQRLSEIIDFNGSIRLSELHFKLSRVRGQEMGENYDGIRQQTLKSRAAILRHISSSFNPLSHSQGIVLPLPGIESLESAESAFAPYSKYYSSMQTELAFRCQRLRNTLRSDLADRSSRLAQLAALDKAMEESLSAHYRVVFGRIPQLLALDFEVIFSDHLKKIGTGGPEASYEEWARAGGSRDKFCNHMRALLLAELDTRLEPVMGMLEALDEEVGDSP